MAQLSTLCNPGVWYSINEPENSFLLVAHVGFVMLFPTCADRKMLCTSLDFIERGFIMTNWEDIGCLITAIVVISWIAGILIWCLAL